MTGVALTRRYTSTDEQLYKDIEGVLEQYCQMLKCLHHDEHMWGQVGHTWLGALVELWDGVCWLFQGKAKPSNWLEQLLKAAKLFSNAQREQMVATVKV